MNDQNLRALLLAYAKEEAPSRGVHPTALLPLVDRVLELHETPGERENIELLKQCVVEQLEASEVACDVLIRIDLTDGWGDAEFMRVIDKLSDEGFTFVSTAKYLGVAEFAVRSSLTPEDARTEAIAAVETITDENPGWNIKYDEVLATPAEVRTPLHHGL